MRITPYTTWWAAAARRQLGSGVEPAESARSAKAPSQRSGANAVCDAREVGRRFGPRGRGEPVRRDRQNQHRARPWKGRTDGRERSAARVRRILMADVQLAPASSLAAARWKTLAPPASPTPSPPPISPAPASPPPSSSPAARSASSACSASSGSICGTRGCARAAQPVVLRSVADLLFTSQFCVTYIIPAFRVDEAEGGDWERDSPGVAPSSPSSRCSPRRGRAVAPRHLLRPAHPAHAALPADGVDRRLPRPRVDRRARVGRRARRHRPERRVEHPHLLGGARRQLHVVPSRRRRRRAAAALQPGQLVPLLRAGAPFRRAIRRRAIRRPAIRRAIR